jgi:hypothetical protein
VTCGCAGALTPALRTGDVIAADAVLGIDAAGGATQTTSYIGRHGR